MPKHCLLALVAAGLICIGPLAIGQDNGNQPPSTQNTPMEHGRGHWDPQQRTEMLTKHLNLTSDQQAKVLDILKSEQSQMQGLHSDSSMSQEDRHAKMMEIHKSTDGQIRGVLDETQQKKWDEMQSRRQERMQEHQGGQAPPPQSPQ